MEILGNICFSEQIFYRKQSLGAAANQYPMMQEPHFRLTFLAQKRYCLLLSALLLQVALVKSGSKSLLGVFIGITKCSFRVKKIYKKKFIVEPSSVIFAGIALTAAWRNWSNFFKFQFISFLVIRCISRK